MPEPVYKNIPIQGTGVRERVVVNEDGSVSRPTQAVFADSSGLNAEATQAAFKSANHTDLVALATKLDTVITKLQGVIDAIGLLPQA